MNYRFNDMQTFIVENWDELSQLSPEKIAYKIDFFNNKKLLKQQISFDIDTLVLRDIVGKRYNHVYDQIKSFMNKNGFEHIEGSVYVSEQPMSYVKVEKVIRKMVKEIPCLDQSVREMHQTTVSGKHSVCDIFHYTPKAETNDEDLVPNRHRHR